MNDRPSPDAKAQAEAFCLFDNFFKGDFSMKLMKLFGCAALACMTFSGIGQHMAFVLSEM